MTTIANEKRATTANLNVPFQLRNTSTKIYNTFYAGKDVLALELKITKMFNRTFKNYSCILNCLVGTKAACFLT